MTTAKETVQLIEFLRTVGLIGADCLADADAGHRPDHPGHVCDEELADYWAWEKAMRPTADTAPASIVRATYGQLRQLAKDIWEERPPDPGDLERGEEEYLNRGEKEKRDGDTRGRHSGLRREA